MKRPIVLVGSLNMDLVVNVARHPTPGETVLGSDYRPYPGGKGANQAVAAQRAGGQVAMIGLVGDDDFGRQLRENLVANHVNDVHVGTWDGPTGLAFITVDGQGQNMIVVSVGANAQLTPDHVPLDILRGAVLVMLQLEVPLETVEHVIEGCAVMKVPVLLNPAPAQPLSDAILRRVHYLVLNETEAALLTGLFDPPKALQRLLERGATVVIITLGERGLIWATRETSGSLPARKVKVVDTTGAGDAFCGALAARLADGVPLPEALQFANAAGALAVTRQGAQPSLPTLAEIETMLARV
jgi:ribokinase